MFWRALKDKDAEIERLESLLARSEAEKQELAAQLAQARGEGVSERSPDDSGSDAAEPAAPAPEAGSDDRRARRPGDVEAGSDDRTSSPPGARGRTTTRADAAPRRRRRRRGAHAAAARLEHTDPRLGEALRHAAAPAEPTPATEALGATSASPTRPPQAQPRGASRAPPSPSPTSSCRSPSCSAASTC